MRKGFAAEFGSRSSGFTALRLAVVFPLLLLSCFSRDWLTTRMWDALVYRPLFRHLAIPADPTFYKATRVLWISIGGLFYRLFPVGVAGLALNLVFLIGAVLALHHLASKRIGLVWASILATYCASSSIFHNSGGGDYHGVFVFLFQVLTMIFVQGKRIEAAGFCHAVATTTQPLNLVFLPALAFEARAARTGGAGARFMPSRRELMRFLGGWVVYLFAASLLWAWFGGKGFFLAPMIRACASFARTPPLSHLDLSWIAKASYLRPTAFLAILGPLALYAGRGKERAQASDSRELLEARNCLTASLLALAGAFLAQTLLHERMLEYYHIHYLLLPYVFLGLGASFRILLPPRRFAPLPLAILCAGLALTVFVPVFLSEIPNKFPIFVFLAGLQSWRAFIFVAFVGLAALVATWLIARPARRLVWLTAALAGGVLLLQATLKPNVVGVYRLSGNCVPSTEAELLSLRMWEALGTKLIDPLHAHLIFDPLETAPFVRPGCGRQRFFLFGANLIAPTLKAAPFGYEQSPFKPYASFPYSNADLLRGFETHWPWVFASFRTETFDRFRKAAAALGWEIQVVDRFDLWSGEIPLEVRIVSPTPPR